MGSSGDGGAAPAPVPLSSPTIHGGAAGNPAAVGSIQPSYLTFVYELWGVNQTDDRATDLAGCLALCSGRDIPWQCFLQDVSVNDTCVKVCVPGSGAIAAPAPVPRLDAQAVSMLERALALATGIASGSVSVVGTTPILSSQPVAVMQNMWRGGGQWTRWIPRDPNMNGVDMNMR